MTARLSCIYPDVSPTFRLVTGPSTDFDGALVLRPDGVDLRLILPTARDAAGRCSNQGRCWGPETYRRDKDRGDRRYSGQGKASGQAMVSDRIRAKAAADSPAFGALPSRCTRTCRA